MVETIETKRLILRGPKMTDLASFYKYAKKHNIGPNAGWLPHTSIDESRKILLDFIEKQEVWAITVKPNDELVGTIGLHIRDFFHAINGIAEIGYALDDLYWNQGLMSEAVEAVIKWAFNEQGFKKLLCGHHENNVASQRVILKNKFKFTHIDDTRVFANENIKKVYMYELVNPNNEGE